ncbi:AraC family transcriptional regulator [Compostibacter hankyongensis]|uniref:AraC family transcriptional regulator n=1 Tax=Compostibacter hankyongensis TaxID=1007089 RepID=A0ABP8FXV3_9BACT
MAPLIFTPHPALQPYIQCYVYTEMGTPGEWTQAEMAPPGYSALIILLETEKYCISVNGEETQHYASPTFTGQITCFSDVHLYDRIKIFFVSFKPCGAYRLLGISQHECTGRSFHLTDLLGSSGKSLSEELINQPDAHKVHAVLEQFLLQRLSLPAKKEICDRLSYVSEQIRLHSHSNQLISRICRKEGYSISRLERHMKEIVGMGPKKFQRIIRFNNTLSYIRLHRDECKWAQVAAQFGYYDQMHFIREFKLFYGKTPEAYDKEGWLMKIVHAG